MSLEWSAKAPGSTFRYTWVPDLAEGDSILSATLTVSSGDATIDSYEHNGASVTAFMAGGTETTVIAASVETSHGETLTETIYLPIRASTQNLGYTVRDACTFALRKIIGNGESAEADELDDCTERLSDMLASWAGQGADIGVPLPLAASDTLYISDAFAQGVKYNLRLLTHEHYGVPLSGFDQSMAMRGLQQIKCALLPTERAAAVYY